MTRSKACSSISAIAASPVSTPVTVCPARDKKRAMFAQSVDSSSTIKIRSGIFASGRRGQRDDDLRAEAQRARQGHLATDSAHHVGAHGEVEPRPSTRGLWTCREK